MRVDYEDLVTLTPSSCTLRANRYSVKKGGVSIIIDPIVLHTPEGNRIPWFFALRQKEHLKSKDIISVVTNLGGEPWEFWEKQKA